MNEMNEILTEFKEEAIKYIDQFSNMTEEGKGFMCDAFFEGANCIISLMSKRWNFKN